jgi:hypothetical protein
MKAFQRCSLLVFAGLCLLMASCIDSKEPISDPQKAKVDPALLGVWRTTDKNGNVEYQHVGLSSEKLPKGILRTIGVHHDKNSSLSGPDNYLFFCSEVGKTRFLNVVLAEHIDKLVESGWNAKLVSGYLLFKYEVQGDTLNVWSVNDDAKRRAIQSGKIKGEFNSDKDGGDGGNNFYFTDTSANIAALLASPDGANVFDKKPVRYQRVK